MVTYVHFTNKVISISSLNVKSCAVNSFTLVTNIAKVFALSVGHVTTYQLKTLRQLLQKNQMIISKTMNFLICD